MPGPRHEVRVGSFRLARTQVTREEYQRFLDDTGHPAPPFWHEPAFAHPRMPAVHPGHAFQQPRATRDHREHHP